MSNFHKLKEAVAQQFANLHSKCNGELFVVDVSKDELWSTYLNSFEEGTNPIYRERREHDCNCCKQFIRTVGNVVAIVDGKVMTLWDDMVFDPVYLPVTIAMSKLVKSRPVVGKFLHYERTAGTDRSFEDRVGMAPITYSHFYINIPPAYVRPKDEIPSIVGEHRTAVNMFYRALTEISNVVIDNVLELIDQGSLYRGAEHRWLVDSFKQYKAKFDALDGEDNYLFCWAYTTAVGTVARIRNSVIGTLLVDLAEGVDMEHAVKAFETKVAPANYKRPTALVTSKMIENAKAKITELGLLSALDRRYARPEDVSVNDVLFVDRNAKKKVGGDVFDELSSGTKATKKMNTVTEIDIDKFISDVLPNIETMEVYLEGKHQPNLVSLIAPVDPTAGQLFKWNNPYSWAYNGDVADSIKERVKSAGGNVTGDFCCRLAWEYRDDLDFHMKEPGGYEIYYGNRSAKSPCGGKLDVDANGGGNMMEHPVENIFYADRSKMREGVYELFVHNFSKRDADAQGFDVEIDYLGNTLSFHYPLALRHDQHVVVAKFNYTHAKGMEILQSLSSTPGSKPMWGASTNQFHRVKMMTLSPNFWNGEGVGNKHYFFFIDGVKNEGDARGFFNEFLSNSLTEHRKVFEVVGSKLKAESGAEDQLSGLGFSSTKRDELIVRVTGSFTRTLAVRF